MEEKINSSTEESREEAGSNQESKKRSAKAKV